MRLGQKSWPLRYFTDCRAGTRSGWVGSTTHDFISFYSLLNCAWKMGPTKSNSNELPISVHSHRLIKNKPFDFVQGHR